MVDQFTKNKMDYERHLKIGRFMNVFMLFWFGFLFGVLPVILLIKFIIGL